MKRILYLFVALIFLKITPSAIRADGDCSSYKTITECGNARHCNWDAELTPKCYENPNLSNNVSSSLDEYNPIKDTDLSTPGGIMSKLLPYILTAAGLALFIMLIMGGFDFMTAGTDAKKAEAGKGRITAAIIGFVIIFAAYWIVQVLEVVLGISILK